MVQSTPLSEFQQNELLKEFASRCQSASKSIQSYINATPAPDEETMLTLIETNDKLSVAMSKYHRAALTARKSYPPPEPQNPPEQQEANANSPQDEAESKPSSKNRIATRFASLRRKPTRTGQGASQQPARAVRTAASEEPVGAAEPNITSTRRQPIDTTSGGGSAPVSVPQSGSTTLLPQTSAGTTTNDRSGAAGAPSGGGYQHNSDDFLIENPFADRFSTTNNNNNDTNGDTNRGMPGSLGPAASTGPAGGPPDSTFLTSKPPGGAQPSSR